MNFVKLKFVSRIVIWMNDRVLNPRFKSSMLARWYT